MPCAIQSAAPPSKKRDLPPFIEEGDQVDMTFTGYALPPYEWYKDGIRLNDNPSNIAGAHSRDVRFAPINLSNAGIYRAAYTDAANSRAQTAPFLLEVQPKGHVPAAGGTGLGFLAAAVILAACRFHRG